MASFSEDFEIFLELNITAQKIFETGVARGGSKSAQWIAPDAPRMSGSGPTNSMSAVEKVTAGDRAVLAYDHDEDAAFDGC